MKITRAQVTEATARYLAAGGTIRRLPDAPSMIRWGALVIGREPWFRVLADYDGGSGAFDDLFPDVLNYDVFKEVKG